MRANCWVLGLTSAFLLAVSLSAASAQPYSVGYTQDFESGLGNWVQDNNDNMSWTLDVGGTTSSGTGPSVDHNPGTSLGTYVYLETSSGSTGYVARLLGPVFDLTTATNPFFDLWYHMYGATMGDFAVDGLEVQLAGTDGAVVAGTSTFTSASATFAAGDVGEYVYIGAGSNQGLWQIASYVDPNTVTLSFGSYTAVDATGLSFNEGPVTANLFSASGDHGDVWLFARIDLAAYKTGTEQCVMIIHGARGTSFTGDMAFDDLALIELPHDVGVTAITSPTSGFGLSATESVSVEISSFGLAETSIPVSYTMTPPTGPPVTVNETWTGTLASMGTTTYTFTATVDMTTMGTYTFDVSTALVGDASTANDGITGQSVLNLVWPYSEDFEANNGGWVAGGTNSSWALGAPAATIINSAPPSGGVNSWVTNLTGNYNYSENSWIQSPDFDLSFTSELLVSFDIWYESEFSYDGAALYYSLDQGATWTIVGSILDPNWYTDNTVLGLSNATGNGEGFSGSGGSWMYVAHEVPGAAGQSSVIFRIWFGSDGSVNREGVAIDNISFVDPADTLLFTPYSSVDASSAIDPQTAGTDFLAQGYGVHAFTQNQDLTDLNVTLTGTATDTDILDAKLWLDDGDGIFNSAGDTQIGTAATFSGGVAALTGLAHTVAVGTTELLWVTLDLNPAAAGGTTFGISIAQATDVTVSPGTVLGSFPQDSSTFLMFGRVATLPWSQDFDGAVPYNLTIDVGPGDFPTADMTTLAIGPDGSYTNQAEVVIGDPYPSFAPPSPPNQLGINFPSGDACGAADFYFDLSGYSVYSQHVTLTFDVADNADENDAEDHVFISLDGGATWLRSLYFLNHTSRTGYETIGPIDLSQILRDMGQDFTGDVVIRFQTQDNSSFSGGDGAFFDNLHLDTEDYPVAEVAFGGAPVPSGVTVNVGNVTVSVSGQLDFTLANGGGLDLTLASPAATVQLVQGLVVANVVGPTATTIVNGSSTDFSVQYAAAAPGSFTFNVVLHTNDPGQESYIVAVSGIANTVPVKADDIGCCGLAPRDDSNAVPLLLALLGLAALAAWRLRRVA